MAYAYLDVLVEAAALLKDTLDKDTSLVQDGGRALAALSRALRDAWRPKSLVAPRGCDARTCGNVSASCHTTFEPRFGDRDATLAALLTPASRDAVGQPVLPPTDVGPVKKNAYLGYLDRKYSLKATAKVATCCAA